MPYNGRAANQILAFYNKARTNLRDDVALIIYFIECRSEYQGTGFPLPRSFDAELAFSAKEQAAELYKAGPLPNKTLGDFSDTASSLSSSIGPSALEVGSVSQMNEPAAQHDRQRRGARRGV